MVELRPYGHANSGIDAAALDGNMLFVRFRRSSTIYQMHLEPDEVVEAHIAILNNEGLTRFWNARRGRGEVADDDDEVGGYCIA